MMTRLRHSDSGATAVLVAISMVVLMGMAAIAIDYALGTNERRLDQTGVDTAAMAGAVELVQGGSRQDIVDEIFNYVDTNIRTVDRADWIACADATRPAGYQDTSAFSSIDVDPSTPGKQDTACISFFKLERIRVRVPQQDIDTTFGRVIGVDSLSTHALAEALGYQFPDQGSPPPFALLNGFSGGDVVCLRTNASGEPPNRLLGDGPGSAGPPVRSTEADPCDSSIYPVDSESFGLLDPTAYFTSTGAIDCKKNANDYFLAAGIDHPIGSFIGKYGDGWDPGDPEVQDGDGCALVPPDPVTGSDTMPIKTGLTAQELKCGMLNRQGSCSSSVPGPAGSGLSTTARLKTGSYVQGTYTFLGQSMDNAALWQFFTKDSFGNIAFSSAPNSCDDLATAINMNDPNWDYYDKRDGLLDCLSDWNESAHDPLFSNSIIDSSRFGFIPLLAEQTLDTGVASPVGPSSCPASGGSCVHIDDFAPVWIQTLYTQSPTAGCNDNAGGWGLHHAGQTNSCGANNGNLDRLSSIVIDCGMLPFPLCQSRGGITPGGLPEPQLELIK